MKFIWFCAAGYSFFCGIGVLALAILFSSTAKPLWRKLVHTTTIIAVTLIFMSATPFNWFFYIIWAVSIIGWLICFALKKKAKRLFQISLLIFSCLTIAALIMNLLFFMKPSMPKQKFENLYIVGDSISAGIAGSDEQTWPKLFRNNYQINVIDLSEAGATVASALRKQAINVNAEKAIVLLEIGGNDFFDPTPYSQFRKELEQLIKQVLHDNHIVFMLELPLFPWQIEYGRIQRQVAKQFNIILIPKRFLVNVLSVKDASTDLAHLSPKGHQLMAKEMWSILGENLQPATSSKTN